MDETSAALAQDLTTTAGLEAQAQAVLGDIGPWAYQLFCFPGEHALSRLLDFAPPVVRFVGIPGATADTVAAALAAVIWLASIILAVTAYRAMRDLYFTMVGYASRIQQRWLRFGRNAARRSTIAVRTAGRKRDARAIEPTISEEVELGELEYAVLRCQKDLAPGRALTAADIADALDVRISQTRKALETLAMLRLIDLVSGTAGHANGAYRLTPHGEGFIAACSGVRAAPVAA